MSNTNTKQFQPVLCANLEATIAAGGTVSNAIDLGGTYLAGLVIPINFDGTQLQFLASIDGTNYYPTYNTAGTRQTATVVAETACSIAPTDFAMWRFIKLVAVTTQTVTDTVIGLSTRPFS